MKLEYVFLNKNDGYNNIVNGKLVCCGKNNFEILVSDEIKRSLLFRTYVCSNNRIMLEARCKKCGKIIHLFDNNIDGYDRCISKGNKKTL